MRRKGDQTERAALATWLGKTCASLQSAKAEAAGATYGASNWLKYNERLEIDLIAMLAIDDGDRAESELVQVWPNGHKTKGLDND